MPDFIYDKRALQSCGYRRAREMKVENRPCCPEDVVKKALTALQKCNYNAFASTYNFSAEKQKQLSALVKEKISQSLENKGGIK